MEAGAVGILLRLSVLAALDPQAFTARTLTEPEEKFAVLMVTVMELLVEVPPSPAGSNQL